MKPLNATLQTYLLHVITILLMLEPRANRVVTADMWVRFTTRGERTGSGALQRQR